MIFKKKIHIIIIIQYKLMILNVGLIFIMQTFFSLFILIKGETWLLYVPGEIHPWWKHWCFFVCFVLLLLFFYLGGGGVKQLCNVV